MEMLTRYKALKGCHRDHIVTQLSRIEGVYAPLFPKERVERQYIEDLDGSYHPVRPPIPVVGSVHNRLSVEISRGCGNGCRFCMAGFGYRPYRERSLGRLEEIIEEAVTGTGYEAISFLSLSSGDYRRLPELIDYVRTRFPDLSVSLPSLKIGTITEQTLELLASGARGGLTFALEAASPGLRTRLNKDIPVETLLGQIPALKKHGWRNVKLYLMIGFPWETEEDLLSLRELIRPFARHGIEVNLSVSPFTPKPHTPFQWLKMEDEEILRDKVALIRRHLRGRGIKVKARDIKTSMIEGLISRGDERLASLFEEIHKKGARLEAWSEFFNPGLYEEWFRTRGVDMRDYLAAKGKEDILPWSFIHTGIDLAFLQEEWAKAERNEKTEDCYSGCAACGLPCATEKAGREPIALGQKPEGKAPQTYATYTIRYGKYGDGRYIGHLDTMEILLRGLRSAGIFVRMHGKFHPKPRISLSPALPVGVESTCEMMEVEVVDNIHFDETLLSKVNSRLPRGMRVLDVLAGGMSETILPHSYILIARGTVVDAGAKWRNGKGRAFYIWKGSNVKDLWRSGSFERIVKVEDRRIHGFRTDHQCHIQ